MLKGQKGITLIALIITIIVLLILAGVTITMLGGQDSAPNKAGEAKCQNEVAGAKDAIVMAAANRVEAFYEGKYVTRNSTGTVVDAILGDDFDKDATEEDNKVVNDADVTVTVDKTNSKIVVTSISTRALDSKHYSETGTVTSSGAITWAPTGTDGWTN